MYLSRVLIHPDHLNNAYEWHRALWSLFPGLDKGTSAPFMYHVNSLDLIKGAQVLMQSIEVPITNADKATVLANKQINLRFRVGQHLSFLLHANPTKNIVDVQNKPNKRNRGKCRVPLIQENDQRIWFKRKLQSLADIHELQVRNRPPTYFRKGRNAGKIVSTEFTGVIEIKDEQAFYSLWQHGIGPAKAFGCGLLLVKRI